MYTVVYPSGKEEDVKSYTSWCKRKGLSCWGFKDILRGRQKQTLGGYTIRKKNKAPDKDLEKQNLNHFNKENKTEDNTMTQVKHEQKIITPKLAAVMLEKNTRNRSVSPEKIKSYIKDMEAGNWVENGESIKFDDTGRLIDGQHRLMACVQSGMPFISTVTTGLSDPNAFKTIDTGRPRGADQVLSMSGISNSTNTTAAIRIVMGWDATTDKTKPYTRLKNLTNTEVLDKAYELGADNLQDGYKLSKKLPRGCGNSTIHAAYLILNRIDNNRATEFFEHLCEGLFSSKGDPCKLLHDRIFNAVGSWNTDHGKTELLALIFKAYNMYCQGNFTQKRLVWNKDSSFPVPYGV